MILEPSVTTDPSIENVTPAAFCLTLIKLPVTSTIFGILITTPAPLLLTTILAPVKSTDPLMLKVTPAAF